MCFWRKNKVTKPVAKSELDDLGKQVDDMKKSAADISLLFKHKVSRLDITEAYVTALISLHPEVKEHPVVLDLEKRNEEYRKEKAKEN